MQLIDIQKIVNGKRYDTKTAEPIAINEISSSNPILIYHKFLISKQIYLSREERTILTRNSQDIGILYVTQKGNYFMYFQIFGEYPDIVPITSEEARKWLERWGFQAELEIHFGSEIEDA